MGIDAKPTEEYHYQYLGDPNLSMVYSTNHPLFLSFFPSFLLSFVEIRTCSCFHLRKA
jgi:hypothetical protein